MLFEKHFIRVDEEWRLTDYNLKHSDKQVEAEFAINGIAMKCCGAGPLEALIEGLNRTFGYHTEITQFDEHATSSGADAKAQACIELAVNGQMHCAVAIADDTLVAAIQSILTAFSRISPIRHRGVA